MAASQSGPVSGSLDTFPRLLLNHALVRGDRPATREKYLGIWQTWNWSQVAQEVRAMACGLAELGFKRGDNLAIIGDNRPRLYWSMCAAQMLGGVPVPMYQDAVANEMAFVLHRWRNPLRHRRGPGAGRQDAGGQGPVSRPATHPLR
jgi:long-chain acyl-CoA synthetase